MLLSFFSLTFIFSWILFAVAGAILNSTGNAPAGVAAIGGLLFIPGAIVPSLVAIGLTRAQGRSEFLSLLKGITEWRRDVRWYVFALGYMVVIKLAAATFYRLATGTWPLFGQIPWFLMAIAIAFSTLVQAGEEIGWRAFALPRMAQRFGLPAASVILGLIWASWHLPFFFIPGSDNFGQSFWMYLMAVTAISVALAWLYWRTDRSLLLVMITHASINNTAGIVTSPVSVLVRNPFVISTSLLAWLTVVLLWICAAYFIIRMRGHNFSSQTV
jgi:membrane protease YdiL (CAAX protease family)